MTPVLLAAAGIVALMLSTSQRKGGALGEDNSAREDMAESNPTSTSGYGIAGVLLDALGWLYTWGGAAGVTTWAAAEAVAAKGKGVVDCSLFACLALVRMGVWKAFRRLTSRQIADACAPVVWGQQRPGDLVYYPGHVMVVLSYPRADGDSEVIGASGGGSSTHGDDPNARVKVFKSARYRRDFVTFMRPKGA